MNQYTLSPVERFWTKVDVRGPDECWEWKTGRHVCGYGNNPPCCNPAHLRAHVRHHPARAARLPSLRHTRPHQKPTTQRNKQNMTSIHDLPGGGGNAIKFEAPGAVVAGRVLSLKTVNTTDLKGNNVNVPVITLEIDGEERSLWVNKGALGDAIKKAARTAGVNDLEGCTLTVKREADGPQKTAGFAAPHQFKAKVEKAVEGADESDPF